MGPDRVPSEVQCAAAVDLLDVRASLVRHDLRTNAAHGLPGVRPRATHEVVNSKLESGQHVPSLTRPLFLFDGDCGVCQNGTDSMRRRFDPPVDMSAYQLVDLSGHGIESSEALEGPILIRANGSHVVGPLAIAEMLRSSRRPYRAIGAAMLLPGVRTVLHAVGPFVYQLRHLLPGSAVTCRVPTADPS